MQQYNNSGVFANLGLTQCLYCYLPVTKFTHFDLWQYILLILYYRLVGVVFLLVAAILSGLASVSIEMLMKNAETSETFAQQCIQLYLAGIPLGIV